MNLRAVNRIMFIKAALTKIGIARKIFISEIGQGKESFILPELSNDRLPTQFWFYDSIIQQIQNCVDPKRKDIVIKQSQFQLAVYRSENFKKKALEKYGFIDPPDTKIFLKPKQINMKESNEINHYLSPATMTLQKSRYLVIEEDVHELSQHYSRQGQLLQ